MLSELVRKLAEHKSFGPMTQKEWDRRREFLRKQCEDLRAKEPPAILACVECGAEIESYIGDVSVCRNCEKKLMRELAPNGFPKHRTLVSQMDGEKVWREPKG
jgi:DNA-directed RNA polymerase subunit RPC12/RpoP